MVDIELSDEQIKEFASYLYYNTDLIADIKETIEKNKEEYIKFKKNEEDKKILQGDKNEN